jgi:hypothetical protein
MVSAVTNELNSSPCCACVLARIIANIDAKQGEIQINLAEYLTFQMS